MPDAYFLLLMPLGFTFLPSGSWIHAARLRLRLYSPAPPAVLSYFGHAAGDMCLLGDCCLFSLLDNACRSSKYLPARGRCHNTTTCPGWLPFAGTALTR